jgi:glycosyltransferase involved in cell wall biosynthesis
MENPKPTIIGLKKVQNESHIIKETLDHLSEFCASRILVYNDCSTDDTPEICEIYKNVKEVIRGSCWDNDRERAEFENRQTLISRAKKFPDKNEWFVYLDADERIEFDWSMINKFYENEVFPTYAYKLKESVFLYYSGFQLEEKIRTYNFGVIQSFN